MKQCTTIRPATRADAQALGILAEEFAKINPSPSLRGTKDLLLARRAVPRLLATRHLKIHVAETQEGIVGCVVFASLPSLVHGGRLLYFVDLIVVLESHRRRGIGKQLMAAVIDLARKAKAYKVVLTTRPDNVPGVSLHRSCRFVTNGVALALYP